MLFSVVTITFNNLDGLKRTAASVRVQSCSDYEWIVIDGGSADGTMDFLKSTTDTLWVSEPDGGIYDAMNKGIARASGDYLIFMNAGDVFAAPDVLEQTKAAMGAARPDFIYGDSYDGCARKTAHPPAHILYGLITDHQAMFYRRAALGDLRYDTGYKIAADYKFTAALLQKTRDTLYCPFPVCVFEQGGVSQRRTALGRAEQARARRELALCGPAMNALIVLRQRAGLILRRIAPPLYRALRG